MEALKSEIELGMNGSAISICHPAACGNQFLFHGLYPLRTESPDLTGHIHSFRNDVDGLAPTDGSDIGNGVLIHAADGKIPEYVNGHGECIDPVFRISSGMSRLSLKFNGHINGGRSGEHISSDIPGTVENIALFGLQG